MTRLDLVKSIAHGLHEHDFEPMHIVILTFAATGSITAPEIEQRERTHLRTAQRYLNRLTEEKFLQRNIPPRTFPAKPIQYTLPEKGKQLLIQIYTDPQPTPTTAP